MKGSELFDIVSELDDIGKDSLDLVNFNKLVRLKDQIVTFFNCTYELCHRQLDWHKSFQAFGSFIQLRDLLALFVGLVEGFIKLFEALLTES